MYSSEKNKDSKQFTATELTSKGFLFNKYAFFQTSGYLYIIGGKFSKNGIGYKITNTWEVVNAALESKPVTIRLTNVPEEEEIFYIDFSKGQIKLLETNNFTKLDINDLEEKTIQKIKILGKKFLNFFGL